MEVVREKDGIVPEDKISWQ